MKITKFEKLNEAIKKIPKINTNLEPEFICLKCAEKFKFHTCRGFLYCSRMCLEQYKPLLRTSKGIKKAEEIRKSRLVVYFEWYKDSRFGRV